MGSILSSRTVHDPCCLYCLQQIPLAAWNVVKGTSTLSRLSDTWNGSLAKIILLPTEYQICMGLPTASTQPAAPARSAE